MIDLRCSTGPSDSASVFSARSRMSLLNRSSSVVSAVVASSPAPSSSGPAPNIDLLTDVQKKVLETRPSTAASVAARLSPEALAGRRLIVLVFDTASMQPEDVQHAVDSASKYVNEQMSAADLVAVTTVSSM